MDKMPKQYKLDSKINFFVVLKDNNVARSSHNVYRDYIDSEHESLVDTCFVADTCLWETAIGTPSRLVVVSEYNDEDTAKKEHSKWVEWARSVSEDALANLKDIHFQLI